MKLEGRYIEVPGFMDLHAHLREPGFEDADPAVRVPDFDRVVLARLPAPGPFEKKRKAAWPL